MPGVLSLREQIAIKTEKLYNRKPNLNTEITVTCGATEAVFSTITAVVNPGDEVIIFEPAFDIYAPAVSLCGGKIKPVALNLPEYSLNHELLIQAINPKTKLIILNSPHNPSGAVVTHEDMLILESLLKGTNIILLSDEVYEHMVFDGKKHCSAHEYAGLRNRSFIVSSLGKTYHTTGWRLGYVIAPEILMAEFRKVHQFVTFSAHTPSQMAFAELMKEEELYLSLPAFFQSKRDLFLDALKGSKFKAIPTSGTYFQFLSYDVISEMNDVNYAAYLTKNHGVASIPVSVFYHDQQNDKMLRFCFAKDDTTLLKAAELLCKI
jgi:methionine aminotransferase